MWGQRQGQRRGLGSDRLVLVCGSSVLCTYTGRRAAKCFPRPFPLSPLTCSSRLVLVCGSSAVRTSTGRRAVAAMLALILSSLWRTGSWENSVAAHSTCRGEGGVFEREGRREKALGCLGGERSDNYGE